MEELRQRSSEDWENAPLGYWLRTQLTSHTEDGKEMQLDLDKMRITQVVEEVDRHSRQLARKEELTGS